MPLTPILIGFFVCAGVCVLVALAQAFAVRRRWRERRYISACHRGLWVPVFLSFAVLGVVCGSALLGYRRLTTEATLAELSARQLAPQRFAVGVGFPDGTHRSVDLAGDQWQLDARVIKWHPRAAMLGAPPLYRIERISGRYADSAKESTHPRTVVALDTANPLDLYELKRRFPQWLGWIDTNYGSAAYMPLLDGGEYRVSLSALGGLVARPANAQTEQKLRAAGW